MATTDTPVTSDTAVNMSRQQIASALIAGSLVVGAPAADPVRAQVAPAIERPAASADAVAVLPFENISGQPQDDWLAAGIADTVLADFEAHNAAVIGPAALLAEARRDGTDLEVERNAIALSRRLGAAWLITGGYQLLGGQLRIIAQVVDVRTGVVTSTVKVDGRREDLFTLQDRIVGELTRGTPLAPSTVGRSNRVRPGSRCRLGQVNAPRRREGARVRVPLRRRPPRPLRPRALQGRFDSQAQPREKPECSSSTVLRRRCPRLWSRVTALAGPRCVRFP